MCRETVCVLTPESRIFHGFNFKVHSGEGSNATVPARCTRISGLKCAALQSESGWGRRRQARAWQAGRQVTTCQQVLQACTRTIQKLKVGSRMQAPLNIWQAATCCSGAGGSAAARRHSAPPAQRRSAPPSQGCSARPALRCLLGVPDPTCAWADARFLSTCPSSFLPHVSAAQPGCFKCASLQSLAMRCQAILLTLIVAAAWAVFAKARSERQPTHPPACLPARLPAFQHTARLPQHRPVFPSSQGGNRGSPGVACARLIAFVCAAV